MKTCKQNDRGLPVIANFHRQVWKTVQCATAGHQKERGRQLFSRLAPFAQSAPICLTGKMVLNAASHRLLQLPEQCFLLTTLALSTLFAMPATFTRTIYLCMFSAVLRRFLYYPKLLLSACVSIPVFVCSYTAQHLPNSFAYKLYFIIYIAAFTYHLTTEIHPKRPEAIFGKGSCLLHNTSITSLTKIPFSVCRNLIVSDIYILRMSFDRSCPKFARKCSAVA